MRRGQDRWVAWSVPLMIAMNVVWGASYLVADIGLRSMEPAALAAWRFLLASALLFPMMPVTRTPIRLAPRDVATVGLIGVVAVAGTYLLGYTGILWASSTDRAVVSPLEPVALALMGAAFLGERLRGRQWGGIAVACAGAYLLIARDALGGAGWEARAAMGQGLMLLSFFTEGMYSILGKPLLARMRPLALTAWSMVIAAAALFLFLTLTTGFPRPPSGASAWGALLFLAIPCTVIGYTLWYMLLEHLPAGVVGVFIFIQPVVGVALGVMYRDERPGAFLLLGAALIAAGVWLTGATAASEPIPHPEPSA